MNKTRFFIFSKILNVFLFNIKCLIKIFIEVNDKYSHVYINFNFVLLTKYLFEIIIL